MNLSQSFQDIAKVQVLLVPIGNLPYSRLIFYYKLFQEIARVGIESINLYNETQNLITTFSQSFPEGHIHYIFHLTNPELSPWFPLQLNRGISILLGIGESTKNILEAYEALALQAKRLPQLKIWRMFVFQPNIEDTQYEECAPQLILFHPDLSIDKLRANIEYILQDLTGYFLGLLGRMAQEFRSAESICLYWEDSDNSTPRKQTARYLKVLGDLCLLIGCDAEAKENHKRALEGLKQQKDFLWVASAKEALLAISVLNCKDAVTQQFLAKIHDICALYFKGGSAQLAVECTFRLARLYVAQQCKTQAVALISALVDKPYGSLSKEQLFEISSVLGDLCSDIGFKRKAGFFYKKATALCMELKQFEAAHKLLIKAADSYQVVHSLTRALVAAPSRDFDNSLYVLKEDLQPWTHENYRGWHCIQKDILENLKSIAKYIGDKANSVKYTWETLLILHQKLPKDLQFQLKLEIEQDSEYVPKDTLFAPLIQLIATRPIRFPIEIYKLQTDPNNVFLYDPWSQPSKSDLNWTKGCLQRVYAKFRNNLAFDIEIEHTRLNVQGAVESCPSKSYLAPLLILAHSESAIHYHLVPLETGEITIDSIHMSCLGVNCLLNIEPITIEVTEALPYLTIKCDKNKFIVFEHETVLLSLLLSNFSAETLGCLEITSDPDIVKISESALEAVQHLGPNQKSQLELSFLATYSVKAIELTVNYSEASKTTWLRHTILIQVETRKAIEILETRISPVFAYNYHSILKELNPSMSNICSSFSKQDNDIGINDSAYCEVVLKLENHSEETISCTLLYNGTSQELCVQVLESSSLKLVIPKSTSEVASTLSRALSLHWKSRTSARHGVIQDIEFSHSDMLHACTPFATFSASLAGSQGFSEILISIRFAVAVEDNSLFLYLYPIKKKGHEIEIVPSDLILAGSLCAPILPGSMCASYQLSYVKLDNGEYCLVAGLGDRFSVKLWSSIAWEL